MGIPGLTTFVDENFSGKWLKYEAKGHLVIDGYSLCHSLHALFNIDWIHGGQYWSFRHHLLHFFNALRTSGVVPVVVFDGIDSKREKEQVIWKRRREWVKRIRETILNEHRHTQGILPVMSIEVFREVLEELQIPLYFVDGEADPDTVAIANYYHCPVVAQDSDYYMFNVEAGYIPISHLNWEGKPVTGDMFTLQQFSSIFGFSDPKLCRMIPSIIGNDFLSDLYDNVLKQDITLSTQSTVGHSRSTAKVERVVRYTARFHSVPELLEHVSTLEGGSGLRHALANNFKKAECMYNIMHTITEDQLMTHTDLNTTGGNEIPEWVLRQYRCGYFVSGLMEILVLGQSFLRIVTDNPHESTAQQCSRDIRQSIYAILAPLMTGDKVSEIVRFEADLRKENVSCSVDLQLPSIGNIHELRTPERIQILCDVIHIDPLVLESFERRWKLVVAASCYWARKCSPSYHIIKSLILCLLFCSRDNNPESLLPRGRSVREDRSGKWMNALHKFSIWQCVYHDVMKLNNILLNPLLFISPAFLFDGRLVLFYACKKDVDRIVESEFSGSMLYSKLLSTITACLPRGNKQLKTATTQSSGDSKSKKSSKSVSSSVTSMNPFAMLAIDSDEEEEEEEEEED